MSGAEIGSKFVRLLCFVGAGVVCTAAINLWRDVERKAAHQTAGGPEKQPATTKLANGTPDS